VAGGDGGGGGCCGEAMASAALPALAGEKNNQTSSSSQWPRSSMVLGLVGVVVLEEQCLGRKVCQKFCAVVHRQRVNVWPFHEFPRLSILIPPCAGCLVQATGSAEFIDLAM
jgi:hypothetical protein